MNKIDIYQWLIFESLLKKYGNQRDSFLLMEKMFPENKRIKQLANSLEKGKSLNEVLINDSFEKSLAYYCCYIPIDKAISIVYQQRKQLKANQQNLLSDLSYQLLLLVVSIVIFYVFMNLVLPSMISSLSTLQSDTMSIVETFKVLNIVKNGFLSLLIVIILFVLYVFKSNKINMLWMFLHKYKMDGFLKCLATYLFVIDLKVLLDNNISLQKSLDIIRHNKNNMLACLLAYQLHNSLIEGNQFEDSLDNQFFDSQFHAICLYGLRNDDFISSLKDYEDIMELKMNRSLKKIGALVQIICYGFVSIIIILAYQVLMIPLTIIEGI